MHGALFFIAYGTGPLTPLSSMAQLQQLYLQNNLLNGAQMVFVTLSRLSSYLSFSVYCSGSLTPLSEKTRMQNLVLSNNQLTGTLSLSLFLFLFLFLSLSLSLSLSLRKSWQLKSLF